jgi:NitT/TauT family transport system substrate-binding protein
MSKPGLEASAKEKGAELRTFLLADHGLKLYSNGVVAADEYLSKNADLVKRFVRASLKGWQFALHNPEKAAQDQLKFVPSLNPQTTVAELGVVKDLAVTPATQKSGLGSFEAADMQASVEFIVKYVGLSGQAPAASDISATGFLPSPAITP